MQAELLLPYVPMEVRQALASGRTLPERRQGAALFADISGFTLLTEELVRELGPQRGAEELTRHLNRAYDVVIDALHWYSGSVVGFSGDAITCWLDDDDGVRALACGLAMQAAIANLGPALTPNGKAHILALKVAVVTGTARHFVVGDSRIQQFGTLAGATLERLALAAHEARTGEVVVDEATVVALGARLVVAEWRRAAEADYRVAVVAGLVAPPPAVPWPALAPDVLAEEVLRPWLLPAVYTRLSAGQGEFLAELRPAVALLLRFGGIDYEGDEAAGVRLAAYVRWVQAVLARYEGTLIDLTIGDKGNYLYAAFGAPRAHEDGAACAMAAAIDLHQPPSAWAPTRRWPGRLAAPCRLTTSSTRWQRNCNQDQPAEAAAANLRQAIPDIMSPRSS